MCSFVHANLEDEKWCRVKTERFDLYGYVSKSNLQSLADYLLTFDHLTNQLVSSRISQIQELRIVAFRTRKEFIGAFQQENFIGFMHPSLRRHLIAFAMENKVESSLDLAFHEYAHYLTRSRIDDFVPLWYEEGFAQFLSTTKIRANEAIVGEIPSRQLVRSVTKNAKNWRKILNSTPPFDWKQHDITDNYRMAWAITHFLFRASRFEADELEAKREQILSEVRLGGLPDDTILRVFELTEEEFLHELVSHLKNKRSHLHRIEVDTTGLNMSVDYSCLSRTDAFLLTAELLIQGNPNEALRVINAGLNREPSNPEFSVLLTFVESDVENRFEEARRVLIDHPMNVNANIRVADMLTFSCMQTDSEQCPELYKSAATLYLTALEQEPYRVDAAFGLGISYLKSDRAGDGLNYLRVAYHRAPWSPRINLFLGEAFLRVGLNQSAFKHLHRAYLWENDDLWRRKAAGFIELL